MLSPEIWQLQNFIESFMLDCYSHKILQSRKYPPRPWSFSKMKMNNRLINWFSNLKSSLKTCFCRLGSPHRHAPRENLIQPFQRIQWKTCLQYLDLSSRYCYRLRMSKGPSLKLFHLKLFRLCFWKNGCSFSDRYTGSNSHLYSNCSKLLDSN